VESTGPALPAPAAREGGGKPVAALVLGIVAIATGFLAVTLLCAVVAITLASLAFQEMSDGRADPSRRGTAVAGMVCGIVALGLWIPVLLAIALTQS
jgi:uncharacterized membrane-anchored protein